MIKIFVVILNWKGKKNTLECLASMERLVVNNFQLKVVMVDNGSDDDSVEGIKKYLHKLTKKFASDLHEFRIIENPSNLGFAEGNNVGIRYALDNCADFVLVLNNDIVVHEELIAKFLEAAEKHKDVGVFSPKIYFAPGFEFRKDRYSEKEKGNVLWYVGGIIDWDNILASNYGVDDTDIGQYETERNIDFATGACVFIRREVLEKIGLFNKRYYLYLEDVDFSQRAKNAGWGVMYIPDAKVWHKVSQSSVIGGELNDYFISRNRLLFGLRYAPFRAKLAILRESLKILFSGRDWQKKGVKDFYLGRFGKGSWK